MRRALRMRPYFLAPAGCIGKWRGLLLRNASLLIPDAPQHGSLLRTYERLVRLLSDPS